MYSVVAAAFLIAVKLAVGFATGSLGLLADAAHSGTDLAAALLTLFALGVTGRAPDPEHPYGHGKAEHLAALAEATFLIAASAVIAWQAIARLASSEPSAVEAPLYALAVVVGVMAVDASRAIVSYRGSRRFRSQALLSNALHFASDFAASAGVLVGLILVRSGMEGADGVVALFVAGLVLIAAARLIRHNVDVLMDRAPEGAAATVREAVAGVAGVGTVSRTRVREAGGRYLADVVVRVPRLLGLERGHELADEVEAAVRERLPEADVIVHMEPEVSEETLEDRVHAAAQRVPGLHEVHNVAVRRESGGLAVSLHVKVAADTPVDDARTLAGRLENEIRTELPVLRSVEAHIEPLTETGAAADETARRSSLAAAVKAAVGEQAGELPHLVRLVGTPEGLLAIVQLEVAGDQPVSAAHDLASSVERAIRARAPEVAEVVVHFGAASPNP